ncbi:hypothetical protein Btru_048129 [Bulinus truncatus]|nr:hypothetical protein Btru_048129 [Bulinus truncatus]
MICSSETESYVGRKVTGKSKLFTIKSKPFISIIKLGYPIKQVLGPKMHLSVGLRNGLTSPNVHGHKKQLKSLPRALTQLMSFDVPGPKIRLKEKKKESKIIKYSNTSQEKTQKLERLVIKLQFINRFTPSYEHGLNI